MSKLHLIYLLIIITFFVVAGTFLYSNRTYAVCTYKFDYCACSFLDDYFNYEYTHAAQHVASQESSCKSNLCECNGSYCPASFPGEGSDCEVMGVGLFQLRHYHCGKGALSLDHRQCYYDRLDPKDSAYTTAASLTWYGAKWRKNMFGGASCISTLGENTCPSDPYYYCAEKDSADGTWECTPPCGTPVSMSDNRHRINNGSTCYINRHGVCKEITNNSGDDLFVGSNSSEEWSSFYNNYPSGVSVSNCDCSLPSPCPPPSI